MRNISTRNSRERVGVNFQSREDRTCRRRTIVHYRTTRLQNPFPAILLLLSPLLFSSILSYRYRIYRIYLIARHSHVIVCPIMLTRLPRIHARCRYQNKLADKHSVRPVKPIDKSIDSIATHVRRKTKF